MSFGELARYTGSMYSTLSIEDKAKWEEAAYQDKERYQHDINEYNPPEWADKKGYILESHRHLLKKKKKLKDPAFPKRPCGSYVFFMQRERPKLIKKFPDMQFTEVGVVMGRNFRNLRPDEKALYEKMAIEDKVRFNEQLAEYHAKKAAETESIQQAQSLAYSEQLVAQQAFREYDNAVQPKYKVPEVETGDAAQAEGVTGAEPV